MSIVSLKIIFVKKQKQTRERPTQGKGGEGAFIYNRKWPFSHKRRIIRVRRVIGLIIRVR